MTGGSALQAVEAVRAAGATPVGLAVVDCVTGVQERIEAVGAEYRHVVGRADLGLRQRFGSFHPGFASVHLSSRNFT